jgi:phenol 2-monooxygenase
VFTFVDSIVRTIGTIYGYLLTWTTDHHKIVVDDESYNYGHGHAYDFLGVKPNQGAVITVRPDQYVSLISSLDDAQIVRNFFDGFLQA